MTGFIAKRVRFQNGEHHSVLSRPGGLPVHETTLYLAKYRKRGRAANTIHGVCMALALLYRELAKADIDLLERLRQGRFLTVPELNRLSEAAQYRQDDLSYEEAEEPRNSKVIDIRRIRMRRKPAVVEVKGVAVGTQASRLRYMADFLEFLATYIGATLPASLRQELDRESAQALKAFLAQVPKVSKRAKLDAREGLSEEDQDRLLKVVHPDSPDNPWVRGFDSQAGGFLISYDKLFGGKDLSDTDLSNAEAGKETSIDRSLRLLYVTCSRARESLALVLWSAQPAAALAHIQGKDDWFTAGEILAIP